jgi:hypothetical protein
MLGVVGEESPEPAAGGRVSFPREDAVAVKVAFERGWTALRIGLRTSTVAAGAGGGNRGVVNSVEDVEADVLLLFLLLEVGRGVVGHGVVGLPPEADPADVDVATFVASEAVGRVFASDAMRAASCAALHALASLTFEDFSESF